MKLLVDTNIFLEIILDQKRTEEAKAFLANPDAHELFMSDYALHSVGVLLFRRKQHEVFSRFVKDMLFNAGVTVKALAAEDMEAVVQAARRFELDFDDAYQYAAAEKYDLVLVSFDGDFDRTERGRRTPAAITA